MGLIDFRARYYDPSLGRFIQADTIVPSPLDPRSYNRYAYVRANPLKYIDPSGHDPLDETWTKEFESHHNRSPAWQDRLVRLFSIAFPDEWGWSNFYASDGSYLEGSLERVLNSERPLDRTWEDMPGALERLAGWYAQEETTQFVRDIGTLFAGLLDRFDEPSTHAAVTGCQKGYSCEDRIPLPAHVWVYLGTGGLPDKLTGDDADGNVHHWAWAFVLGYDKGGALAVAMNTQREFQQAGGPLQAYRSPGATADIWLGNRGAMMVSGVKFSGASPTTLSRLWRRDVLLQWP